MLQSGNGEGIWWEAKKKTHAIIQGALFVWGYAAILPEMKKGISWVNKDELVIKNSCPIYSQALQTIPLIDSIV